MSSFSLWIVSDLFHFFTFLDFILLFYLYFFFLLFFLFFAFTSFAACRSFLCMCADRAHVEKQVFHSAFQSHRTFLCRTFQLDDFQINRKERNDRQEPQWRDQFAEMQRCRPIDLFFCCGDHFCSVDKSLRRVQFNCVWLDVEIFVKFYIALFSGFVQA